jgi:phosphonate transport system permease protein
MSGAALASPALRDPAWAGRVFWLGAAAVLLVPMLVATEFRPWSLVEQENLKVTLRFLADFLPPKADAEFLVMVAREAWRTVAIATAGVFLALLIVLRSVPELVWALVFVRVVGLGPTAGVLAIALTYSGMLGKVYGEILESGEMHATTSLLRNGAGRLQAFFYGLLPQNAAELTSYTVYRWECAIRSSAVLGFVGAGGLGQQMDTSIKIIAASEVSTMLLVFIFLVWLGDLASSGLRKALG